ncbi:chemotaxis protein CheB [Methylobacterium oryzae CBMB20]
MASRSARVGSVRPARPPPARRGRPRRRQTRAQGEPLPPVHRRALLRSAAQTRKERVIGTVLAGLLNDGTSGLWSITRLNGTTIVQDPGEADIDSMPLGARAGADRPHPARGRDGAARWAGGPRTAETAPSQCRRNWPNGGRPRWLLPVLRTRSVAGSCITASAQVSPARGSRGAGEDQGRSLRAVPLPRGPRLHGRRVPLRHHPNSRRGALGRDTRVGGWG